MSTIMKTPMTLREKVMFALSVLLFALLNLVPGLTGSYADAQYGGGGGGGYICTSPSSCGPSTYHCAVNCLDGGNCSCTTT